MATIQSKHHSSPTKKNQIFGIQLPGYSVFSVLNMNVCCMLGYSELVQQVSNFSIRCRCITNTLTTLTCWVCGNNSFAVLGISGNFSWLVGYFVVLKREFPVALTTLVWASFHNKRTQHLQHSQYISLQWKVTSYHIINWSINNVPSKLDGWSSVLRPSQHSIG